MKRIFKGLIITLLIALSTKVSLGQNVKGDSLKRDDSSAGSPVHDPLARGSLARMADTAHMGKRDGRRFRLSKTQWQKFNHDMRNGGSNLFKPTLHNVSDTLLLKDSVYVNAFRLAAYNKALKDQNPGRTVGHYILMGSIKVLIAIPYYTLAFFFCHGCSFPPHYQW